MIRKAAAVVILVPLAIVIVLMAIGNRQAVTLSLDPLLSDPPSYSLRQPLFLIILVALIAGVIIGGCAAWLRQRRWRRDARRSRAEIGALRAETQSRRERLAAAERAAQHAVAYRRPPAA